MAIVYLIELLETRVFHYDQWVFIQLDNVFPESDVHTRDRDVLCVRMRQTQVTRVVPIDLPLVHEFVTDSFASQWVFGDHLLGYLVFQIKDLVLIYEIVELAVHATTNVVFRIHVLLTSVLKHCVFDVSFTIPRGNDENVISIILGHNLDEILAQALSVKVIDCGFIKVKRPNLGDLDVAIEVNTNRFEVQSADRFSFIIEFGMKLCSIILQYCCLDKPTTLDDEVLINYYC